jgi:hypothetical protein
MVNETPHGYTVGYTSHLRESTATSYKPSHLRFCWRARRDSNPQPFDP